MSGTVIAFPVAPAPRGVRVYAVLGPASYAAAGARIALLLFGLDGGGDATRSFTVHETSGGIAYADRNLLWQGGAELPSDPERVARGFLEDANRRVATDRRLGELGWHALVPEDLRPRWIGAVTAADAVEPDHLLVQFACYLAVDDVRVGRVEGASVELRIGRGARILSLSTRWRPIAYDLLSAPTDPDADIESETTAACFDLEPPQPNVIAAPAPSVASPAPAIAVPGAHVYDNEAEEPPEYVYWLADENVAQRWLAPFRFARTGHHGTPEPASVHSLSVDMRQRPTGDGTELVALVRGGSREIVFQWGYWSPADFFEQGLRDAGTGATARLPAGAWQVALQVFDRTTGAAAQIERLVFGSGVASAT